MSDVLSRNEPELVDFVPGACEIVSTSTDEVPASSLKQVLLLYDCTLKELQENLACNESIPIGSPMDLLSLTVQQIESAISEACGKRVSVASSLVEQWRKVAREILRSDCPPWLATYRSN